MIHKYFHKVEARAEKYDHSHCYASCDPKTEKAEILVYIPHKLCLLQF